MVGVPQFQKKYSSVPHRRHYYQSGLYYKSETWILIAWTRVNGGGTRVPEKKCKYCCGSLHELTLIRTKLVRLCRLKKPKLRRLFRRGVSSGFTILFSSNKYKEYEIFYTKPKLSIESFFKLILWVSFFCITQFKSEVKFFKFAKKVKTSEPRFGFNNPKNRLQINYKNFGSKE